ncbi:ribonuclease D [Sandaracinus amylolyticus]|uniref:ribonuclease D n=1 Tax=Sandaracinus amylolyticus TaxID=927083 RepID=UPI001F46679E|nr:ribonuclease D [Sandaracinus amylolyticus]UJR78829.1 Ribonuclease D [Sandaracinus amylolyticus]
MIDRPEELERLARALAAAPAIGLDTEGDGLYRYRTRLCTMQIAHPQGVALIDTLALADRRALAPIIGESGPEKVLHDCAFDARLLAREGLPLANVFDTAVAARFLGEVSTGLSSLLDKHLGVTIGKDLQQADWGKRPLDAAELAYLEQDVRDLLPLASVLRDRCADAGILDEVRVESAWAASANAEPEEEPGPAWLRVKGAGDLRTGAQRAVLREIAALRERIAQEEDVPPFRVLPNPVLIVIARKMPRDRAALDSIHALAKRPELATEVLDAVGRGLDAREVPREELDVLRPPAPPFEQRERRKRLETALTAWRKREAEERGVNVQVVLPGHCLRDLAGRAPRDERALLEVPGFGECRVVRYGRAVIEIVKDA